MMAIINMNLLSFCRLYNLYWDTGATVWASKQCFSVTSITFYPENLYSALTKCAQIFNIVKCVCFYIERSGICPDYGTCPKQPCLRRVVRDL